MRPQARAHANPMRFQAGGPAHYIFLGWALPGWARPVYINRHPQPPAKYIGFSEISKVTLCYRILQE
jgi:hypothetical protein